MTETALHVDLKQPGPIPLDAAFNCGPGNVLAVFGPSGSGKTTILRTIAGLYTPAQARVTSGREIWLDTKSSVNLPPHHRRTGFVFQDYALFPHLTVLGNVTTALGHRPHAERRARALELLQLVHLRDYANRKPAALSGGERQRVALARALAREPRVLLLDEPFAAVDRALRHVLQNEINDIRRVFDIPIVLVTHDFDDVVRMATHLAILDAGRVVAHGSLEELTSSSAYPWLRKSIGLGSVIDAEVRATDPVRGIADLAFDGGVLHAAAEGLTTGGRVRVRVPAATVILASEEPRGLSVHNVLPASVTSIQRESGNPGHLVIVQLKVGNAFLLAEVTEDAIAKLGIVVGGRITALIKSASLEVRRMDGRAQETAR